MGSDSYTSTGTANVQPQPGGLTGGPIKRGRRRAGTYSEFNVSESKPVLDEAPQQRQRKQAREVSPAFDATPSESDIRYVDLPERDLAHGPRPNQLARMLTRPCYPIGEEPTKTNHHFWCIASSLCNWSRKTPDRQLSRIFGHASRCQPLARWKPDLAVQAEIALANMAPGGLQSATPQSTQMADSSMQPLSDTPAISNPFARFDPTTGMNQGEQIDHAIARLLCDSASPVRLVEYPAWNKLLHLLNPQLQYSSPSLSYISEKLIPAESRRAVLHMREYLKNQTNLSLSFDGLTAGEHPVYTVHVCTADRHTFLYYADVFYGSHTSKYIEDLLVKVVNELGAHRVSSVVSDDTNVTKKARRLATARYPSILNLADPVHKFNLCVQDICLDKLWVSGLRKLLTHFKMSTHATAKLNAARKLLAILVGLQSIGKTQFATVFYAVMSVLENLPALYKIYRDGDVDTVGTPLPKIVAEVIDETRVTAIEFKLALTELANVLEPLARALLCLESTHSTLSDVYFFWLSALAILNKHFSSNNSLLSSQDKSRLQATIYRRFNEAINEAPTDVYVTTFFLDPRYRTASIYLDTADINATPPIVDFESHGVSPRRKTTRPNSRLTESLYTRVRKQLLQILRSELESAENIPGHPLYHYDALQAKNKLIAQLHQYHQGSLPFRQFSGGHEGALQYWSSHKVSPFAFILAYLAEKLFSVLPNSMCDERAGSRLTHLYSKLRTRFDAKTMIEQMQFSQFSALIDGLEAPKRHKKFHALSRFSEIDPAQISEHTAPGFGEYPVALSDEPGEEWLDRQGTSLALDFGECESLEAALTAHCIDLNSPLLIDALTTTPSDKMDTSSDGLLGATSTSDTGSRAYTRTVDILWDD
ncbi:hypothetical protein FRC08_011831 [Ceratobasidium sp. 394]|nr:hypothetical protein FRC08_011831 [Ceratobasidium sp. 394]